MKILKACQILTGFFISHTLLIIYFLVNQYGVGTLVYSFVQNLPIPETAKIVLVRGVIATTARTTYETLDDMPSVKYHPYLRYVLHPSQLLQRMS